MHCCSHSWLSVQPPFVAHDNHTSADDPDHYPVTGITVAFGLFAVFWVGSTAPTVEWFGSVYSHGPRSGNEVALTFDDGPNPPFTLEIASILEAHGVRGTFFEVGKAVVQRPDITKQLIARGHTVGDHSYYHGAFSYLNPAYPELDKAQTAFKDAVGTCPALYRPPHGTHTPFMSDKIDSDGMTLINWDVSAQDWIETDPQRLATNILARVKPGSIILLHDGIDGNIGADRSVILDALPLHPGRVEGEGFATGHGRQIARRAGLPFELWLNGATRHSSVFPVDSRRCELLQMFFRERS